MSFWSSSSLTASDKFDLPRHERTGFLKNGKVKHSKQEMTEKRLFGNKFGRHGMSFSIGRKFRGSKSGSRMPRMPHMIGPSVEEFDRMMGGSTKHFSVTHDMNKKRTPFRKKLFS